MGGSLEDTLFLPAERLRDFCAQTETPFFLYDAGTIRQRAAHWKAAFSFCRYRLAFPVRALPNPHILRLLRGRLRQRGGGQQQKRQQQRQTPFHHSSLHHLTEAPCA